MFKTIKINKVAELSSFSNFSSQMVIVIVIAIGLVALGEIIPDLIYLIYAYPAAYIASFFMNSQPLLIEGGEILIPLSNRFINITPSCNGYGFFSLLYAIFVSYILRSCIKVKAFVCVVLALPIAYGVTIIMNGFRIICTYQINEVCKHIFPSNFQAAIHQGVGIALFLTTIMLISLLLERRFHNG